MTGVKPYGNLSGNSGVVGYEIGRNYIRLRFRSNEDYLYEVSRVGRKHLQVMQKLALAGEGLATYINAHPEVRNCFG